MYRTAISLLLTLASFGEAPAQAVGYAKIDAIHVGGVGDPWIKNPQAIPPGQKEVLVRLSNGAEVSLPVADGQVGFSNIQIAMDRSEIGWTVEQNACPQSYPCETYVRVRLPDGTISDIASNDGAVWDWDFTPDGSKIVIHSGPTHGDTEGYYNLFDLRSRRRVAAYDISTNGPKWVQNYLSRYYIRAGDMKPAQ